MSEHGIIAYAWYAPVVDPHQRSQPGQRNAVPYTFLRFYSEVTPDMFEVADESKVMAPWRATSASILDFHPEHRSLFWDGGVAGMFRGQELVTPRHNVLLSRRQYGKFETEKAAAVWGDSIEEVESILKILLR